MSSPSTSLRSVLRLRPVFDEAGEPGIFSLPEPRRRLFQVPEPIWRRRDQNFSECQGLYGGDR